MTIVGPQGHSHAYHVAMVTSVSIAALTFLALVVLAIVTANAGMRQVVMQGRGWSRTMVALVLAAVTGLLVSLPFAFASSAHGITSFLVRELVYASVIAPGALGFAAVMAHIATGEIGSGDYEPGGLGIFSRRSGFRVNPATGLPMNGLLDWDGNCYGCNSHSSTLRTVTGHIEPG
jgi:hypothetical protein